MKKLMFVIALVAVVGCKSKNDTSGIYTDPSVTQVNAVEPAAYQPAPEPVVYDTAPAQPAYQPAADTGHYTIKKGDTLYSIAKNRYGNGNQYTKIVSANPGLDPSKLKVGQTIVIP